MLPLRQFSRYCLHDYSELQKKNECGIPFCWLKIKIYDLCVLEL